MSTIVFPATAGRDRPRHCPRRIANRPGSQRMAGHKSPDVFCSPPRRADMLRTGTVRGPGAFPRCARSRPGKDRKRGERTQWPPRCIREKKQTRRGMGWPTGFEPATTRSTIWGSNQAELRPPTKGDKLVGFIRSVKLRSQPSSRVHVFSSLRFVRTKLSALLSLALAWRAKKGGARAARSGAGRLAFAMQPQCRFERFRVGVRRTLRICSRNHRLICPGQTGTESVTGQVMP